VIAPILKSGSRTHGLLQYLYGPGRANEHTDPHIVGAWRDFVPDPGRNSSATLDGLAMLLDMPVHAMSAKRPARHVWHAAVSLAEDDRTLTDAEWGEVAREMIDASGIAPQGDDFGCRWVAVRHADNHIHLLATLARQDGTNANSSGRLTNNAVSMRARCIELESRLGLTPTAPIDRTASPAVSRAEQEKATRLGRSEAPRVTLARAVRDAAASAGSEAEFFDAIESAGIRLHRRIAPDGAVTGYSVALPGDRTAKGRPIFFSGTRLAPDLSLPRIRERWVGGNPSATIESGSRDATRAAAWERAAEHVHQAAAHLGASGDAFGAGEVAALGDFLTTFAAHAPVQVREELRDAARAFERAGRAPVSRRMDSTASGHLRTAGQLVILAGTAAASGAEPAALLALLAAVALAVVAVRLWHQARGFREQEQAARQAGIQLRAATEVAYGATSGLPGGRLLGTGGREALTESTQAYERTLHEVLPDMADAIISESAWPALAATLRTAENAGYDPARTLAEVSAARGFDTAVRPAQVLVWRLQRRMETDAQATDVRARVDRRQGVTVAAVLPATGTGTEGASGRPVEPLADPIDQDPGEMLLGDDAGAPSLGATVREAVPEHADVILRDPAAVALAGALRGAVRTGHDPVVVLTEVTGARGLDDADSVAQVLTWRLQGRARQDEREPGARAQGGVSRSPRVGGPSPHRRPDVQAPPQGPSPGAGPRR